MLIATLNSLLIAGPSPEECVPTGPQSNPEDIDADASVGAPAKTAEEGEGEGEAAAESAPDAASNDVWLSLALMADFAVETLLQLKADFTNAPRSGSKAPGGAIADPEARTIRDAKDVIASIAAADEELQDVWFEKMPELDINSITKLVAFSALCLYHMRRWSSVVVLCRKFNDATCSVFATTFLPLMIGAQAEVCNLSQRATSNTDRYMAEARATFDAEQKKLPRKLLRQLALQGEISEPEKAFNIRNDYYEAVLKRQKTLDDVWSALSKAATASHSQKILRIDVFQC